VGYSNSGTKARGVYNAEKMPRKQLTVHVEEIFDGKLRNKTQGQQ
jgi:hypothetical protein